MLIWCHQAQSSRQRTAIIVVMMSLNFLGDWLRKIAKAKGDVSLKRIAGLFLERGNCALDRRTVLYGRDP